MESSENPTKTNLLANLKGRLSGVFRRGPDTGVEYVKSASLKDYLLRITRGAKIPPEDFPSSFDLGEFGKEADKLAKAAQSDPQHMEHISKAVTTSRGDIFFISSNRGEATQVSVPTPVPMENDLLLIHTHPSDTPFSPPDLDSLFTRPNWQGWTMPAEMVVTPTLKVLIFRTSKTPELLGDESWNPKMDMTLEPAMEEEVFSPREGPDVLNSLGSISNKRMYALTRIAQKYHLKLYSCPVGKNIAYQAN